LFDLKRQYATDSQSQLQNKEREDFLSFQRNWNMKYIFFMIGLLFFVSCESKKPNESSAAALLILEGGFGLGGDTALNKVTTKEDSPGVFLTTVNATSTRNWVFVNLNGSGIQVLEADSWDLRFRRFLIGTNSGTSGSGSGAACKTGLTNFNAVTIVTTCSTSFQVDSIQSQTGGGGGAGDVNDSANPEMFEWYSYNNTILTAKSEVYIVRGKDGTKKYKVQMTDYYSMAGTSGYPTFRWAKLN